MLLKSCLMAKAPWASIATTGGPICPKLRYGRFLKLFLCLETPVFLLYFKVDTKPRLHTNDLFKPAKNMNVTVVLHGARLLHTYFSALIWASSVHYKPALVFITSLKQRQLSKLIGSHTSTHVKFAT